MSSIQTAALNQEWSVLQNNYEQYERNGLLIKLCAVIMYAFSWAFGLNEMGIAILLLILWLQEGIFKTYQSRIAVRILRIEALFKQGATSEGAFQLHSDWMMNRKGTGALLLEYVSNALRPTVAFPYAVLLLLAGISFLLWMK